MKPKVIILATGGTIAHRSKNGVAVMDFDPRHLASDLNLPEVDLDFKVILQKGSMDIVPEDWHLIATAAADAIAQQPSGIVILHGTDTMHYTAAALSFLLQNPGIPIVMTGSMIPGGDKNSDSQPNLRDAVRVAAYADLGEVCIVFSADRARSKGLIFRGNRAKKIHSHAIDAFGSINMPALGTVERDAVILTNPDVRRRKRATVRLALELERNVVLIKLNPAMTPDMLARQLQSAAGAVLEGTGVGHIKTDLQKVVADFGRPAVITTQASYGGERLGSYDVDKGILAIPNLIPVGDMTSETALVKLMWALKQPGNVRSTMRTNIAGEISDTGNL